MRIGLSGDGLRDLHALWDGASAAQRTDAELVERFARRRDASSESAFAALVARHGPMVLATCRRALGDRHEADAAFQATFLVLARKAGSLRVGETLGPWLHEVARRVAKDARASSIRRNRRIDPDADPSRLAAPTVEPADDLRALIDEELARLPGRFRTPIILATARLATLAPAPSAAATLAAGVIQAMMYLKMAKALVVTAVLATLGAGGLLARQPARPREAAVRTKAPAPADGPKAAPPFRFEGSVRVEGTGDPVAGATIDVHVNDTGPDYRAEVRRATTGPDGRFALDLPAGQAQAWIPYAPVGYWLPGNRKAIERFAVSPAAPAFHRDYTARRGTVWTFRVTTWPEKAQRAFVIAGRVVDEAGRPIVGARVALILVDPAGGSAIADRQATTDAEGRYRLRAIPRQGPDGKPTRFGLAVTKDGRAGVDVFDERGGAGEFGIPFQPGDGDTPQVVSDIRLDPGVSLGGTVVAPDGSPAAGARVMGGGYALRGQFTKTDDRGRFTVRNLPRGMVSLSFEYGNLFANGKYLADGSAEELKVALKPKPTAAAARPNGLAPGTMAPGWSVSDWTDGKARTPADLRGRVVLLDFWGDWCGPCIAALPTLDRLRAKFEPRGVAFVSIHTPGGDPETIRRLFALKKVGLVSAIDEHRKPGDDSRNGITAERYGVGGYPTFVLIDREGKVAFHSGHDPKARVDELKALGRSMGLDEATMTPEDFTRLLEAFLARQVERALGAR